jgi:hypothetical protein
MRAIACDDDELLNFFRWVIVSFRRCVTASRMTRRRGLRQEPRERGPRRAPAGWARRGANFKALVAIETQGELSQREMCLRSKHSSTADHRRVTSGTGTGPNEPVVATVASAKLRAARPVYGTLHPQPPHEVVERALATAVTGEPDTPQDFDAWNVRILAQPLRDLRRVRRHGRRAPCAARSRSRHHLTRVRAVHGRTPPQIRYRNRTQERSVTSAAPARTQPGESLTEPIILEPVLLLSGFRKTTRS